MEKKYINEKLYKKTSRVSREKRSVKKHIVKKLDQNTSKKKASIKSNIKKQKVQDKKIRNKIKFKLNKRGKINIIYFTLFLLIVVLLRLILKDPASSFIPNIFNRSYINNDILRIGMIDNNLNDENSNNIILRELRLYSNPSLIKIGKDYEIIYEVIKNVKKIKNTEYELLIDNKYNITKEDIKASIYEYMNPESIYYSKVYNIDKIEFIDKNIIKLTLKEDDPMFIYNLNIPVRQVKDKEDLHKTSANYYISYSSPKKVIYTRSDASNKENIKEVQVVSVSDMQDQIEKYKQGEIDMFFSNSKQVFQQLNDVKYNTVTFKTGNINIIIGNSESKIFSIKSVRQAISLGLDMKKIIQEVYLNETYSTICIPYIYNNCFDNYDVYGAENALLSAGYIKRNGIYSKKENDQEKKINFELLVNKDDIKKVSVANKIKEDIKKIGIEINIVMLAEDEIISRVKSKDFDLVLSEITINEKPDLNFLKEYIYINDDIVKAGKKIKDSDIDKLIENLNYFKDVINNEIPMIPVLSEDINIIYNNNIDKINYAQYMNIFNELMGS